MKSFISSRKYPILIGIFLIMTTAGSLILNLGRAHTQYKDLAIIMGRSLLQGHIVTRKWNAIHEGVYVPVTETFKPDPYLVDPFRDVTTIEGIKLTKVNPAYMTSLISQLMKEEEGAQFHMASSRPINPRNITSPMEAKALGKFERGEGKEFNIIDSHSKPLFSYMVPMKTEKSCVKCHGANGYRTGDILGVMSISFSYAPFQDALNQSIKKIFSAHVLFLGIGIVIIAGIMNDITRRRNTEEKFRRNSDIQSVLRQILQISLEPIPLDEQLERTLDLIFSIHWFALKDKGCIFLEDDEPEVLAMRAHRGFSEGVLASCEKVRFNRCICGKAASTREIQFTECIDESHESSYEDIVPHGHYCVPILSGSRVLGVLNIYLEEGHKRVKEEEEFLTAVASTLAGLIKRKKAEEDLLHLATAVEQAGDIIFITDAQGTIQYVNPAFEEATGYWKEEVIGKNPRILKSGEHGEDFYREMWDTLTRGEVWHGRFVNRKKDGTLYHEETTISPNKDSSGKIINFVAVKHDVTHEVALENQLRHAQKMEAVGQLAGGVAHDFNNILTAIMGYASFLKVKVKDDTILESYVNNILISSERAADLTKSLLAFSRKNVINPKAVYVNTIVGRVGNLLTRLIGEDIDLHIIPSEKDMSVMADSGQIEQVLVNLATNARDAMPGGGAFTIKTEPMEVDGEFVKVHGYGQAGRYALISATDTGVGMEKDTIDKIFEPFFTNKEVGRGTGLGLAIVYGIVKQHDGYINVYSEPGIGTTFKIYLPLVDAKVEDIKKQELTIPLVGTETVLLAEDDAEVRMLIKDVLEKFGYKVIEAVNGDDAVKKFVKSQDSVDLLIFDVVMPRKNGKEAYDEVRVVRPDVKILFMSGYTADIIYRKGLIEGGLPLLSKPISPSELLKSVRKALD